MLQMIPSTFVDKFQKNLKPFRFSEPELYSRFRLDPEFDLQRLERIDSENRKKLKTEAQNRTELEAKEKKAKEIADLLLAEDERQNQQFLMQNSKKNKKKNNNKK